MNSAAEQLLRRADDDHPALYFEEAAWSYRQVVDEARRRASIAAALAFDRAGLPTSASSSTTRPSTSSGLPAAALSGSVVVGINSTYRGEQLGQLISHTDCEVVVTSTDHLALLEGAGDAVSPERLLVVDGPQYRDLVDGAAPSEHPPVGEDDLFLLIFTSGSTGLPKAVRCTQGRFARNGSHVSTITEETAEDVVYCAPAVLPLLLPVLGLVGRAGRRRTHRHPATVLCVRHAARRPALRGDDPHLHRQGAQLHPGRPRGARRCARSRCAWPSGNEASVADIRAFARRFGCTVRDSLRFDRGDDHHPA